ncbi:MAG TPA: hypothetical protein ENH12_00975 [Proteobacteria bacterium]|nr:hypothetical protein [Pseudomonadota bacterium]
MKTPTIILITAVLSISVFLPPSFSLPVEEVKPLIKKEYYPEVLNLIRNAEKSIYLVMYGIQLKGRGENDMANTLVEELIEAKRRGVKVKVILETSGKEEWGEYVTQINEEVMRILRSEGIQISLDDKKTTTHAKVLVVDEEITVLGSHNWTFAAFERNNESSVKIKSRPVAQKYISYFHSIKR